MDFFCTHISPKAIESALAVLQSGWLSEGQKVKEFETALSSRLKLKNPVALNSGTSALHLALTLIGITQGDEVILPAQTFIATGMVILVQGAVPVFADIDPATGNISCDSIAKKITSRTKAIIPVHWGGYPCDMDEILFLAKKNGLHVIEDAAHALGSSYKNKPIGAISDFTAFSFQAIKHLTTGDGGALCCNNVEHARQALIKRWFGIDRANSQPSILGERIYDANTIGYKYHMNDLGAAIGIGNLEDFSQRLHRRQEIAGIYRRELANVPGIHLLKSETNRISASWLFTMLVEKREAFIRHLMGNGIPASVVHLRIDNNAIFGGIREDLVGQAEFNKKQVAIPVHEKLLDDDVSLIIKAIKSGW
jgi:perosamine synthetase